MKRVLEETICRLCLRVDGKVYKLNSPHHKAFIESIIKLKKNIDIPTEDHYVCYICNALITKTYNFMQTIWKSQEIICGILKITDMVTKPMLEHIDRHCNGLNPITLSSVIICESEICENRDENTKIKLELEVESKEESIQHKENEENDDIMIIENVSTDENCLISDSDEDIMELENCYLNEEEFVVSGDPLKENYSNLRQIVTKDLSVEPCEDKKPGKKIKTQACVNKSKELKKEHTGPYKRKDSSSTKKVIKCKKNLADEDYQPDSTSHSEDSEYDSYDDEGKRIKRPKDGRVYPRQCDHCHYEVQKKFDHYRHYQYMHPNIEYPYSNERRTCLICGKLVSSHHLHLHEESHETLEFKCTFCPKVFPSRNKVYNHEIKVHPKKTYTCDYCSKIFKTKTDFLRHIRIHTGSKPFKCHICGDSFAHSGNRTLHIRSKHQNLKIVPKKKSQKVRRNDKQETTCSDDEAIRSPRKKSKTKKLRKSKNQHENTDVALNKKDKNEKREGGKRKHRRSRKPKMIADHDGTTLDTDMNIDGDQNNQNAEVDSEDEILIMIKNRK